MLLNGLWHLTKMVNLKSQITLYAQLSQSQRQVTRLSYLCQEMSVLCKFLESALDWLQVQAAALGRGPEVLVFSVRQKVGVSAMIQCRQIKNISEGNITSSTFDPGNIDSNRKWSKKCCGFLCKKNKNKQQIK